MSLLTGARKSNVLAMRWDDIHLDRATWTIPQTKNGSPHTVPLVPAAIAVLNQRKAVSMSEWVFPGTGKTGHLVEPKSAWKRILDRPAPIFVSMTYAARSGAGRPARVPVWRSSVRLWLTRMSAPPRSMRASTSTRYATAWSGRPARAMMGAGGDDDNVIELGTVRRTANHS